MPPDPTSKRRSHPAKAERPGGAAARPQEAGRPAAGDPQDARRQTAPPGGPQDPKRAAAAEGGRASRQAERREAILAAALEEFSVAGFAAARLDDVARRAGVAKGTIYLYFDSKESLFQELVRSMLSPVVRAIEAAPVVDLPVGLIAEKIVDVFVTEVFETRRKDVLRLIIAEGPRFPKLAEFYYHEVIERILKALRALLTRAVARGELPNDVLVRFPQLLMAPALVAVVWSALFGNIAPLDVRALMRAHLELLFAERSRP
jgi:AcrR family transcriptional regulator